MPEKRFRNYLELPLSILAAAGTIGVPCGTLMTKQLLNPSPTDPYCVPISYPLDCTIEDNPDCRGGAGCGTFNPWRVISIATATFTLLVTMTLIVHSFYRNEHKLREDVKDKQIKEDDEELQALLYAQEMYGIITRQATLYIAAFVLTWIFGFIEFLWQTDVIELSKGGVEALIYLRIIFQPLQGFFNLIIFVYHKAYVHLRSDEDMTMSEAIIEIFLNPVNIEDSVQIHNLDVVFEDTECLDVPYMGKDHGGEVENGLDEVNLSADNGRTLNSRDESKVSSSAFIHSGELSPIDEEERPPTRRYYFGGQAATLAALEMVEKNDVSGSGLSFSPGSSLQDSNDGVSFASENRSPSHGRTERNDRIDVFND